MGQLSCLGGHTGWGWGARELNYKRDRGTGDQAPLRGEGRGVTDLQGVRVFMCVCMYVHAHRVSEGKEGFQENPGTLPG